MEYAKLWMLAERSSWRDSKPFLVEGKFNSSSEIELGRITQAREDKRVAIFRQEGKLSGKQFSCLLTGSIGHFHPAVALLLTHLQDKSGTRFRAGPQRTVQRENAPDDISRLRRRVETRAGQNRLSLTFIPPWRANLPTAFICLAVSGPSSTS